MSDLTPQDIANTTPEALAELMRGPRDALARWVQAAAEAGLGQAQVMLGRMLLEGDGVQRNPHLALEWFKRAAGAGNAQAMEMVAHCYDQGWGVAADPVLATEWFRSCAEAGSDKGMYQYANRLAAGRGAPVDLIRAFAYYEQAAALGHAASTGAVGRFYETGEVVGQDPDRAFEAYGKAAQAGDAHGMFHYARLLHERGQTREAFDWFARVPQHATPEFLREARKALSEAGISGLDALYVDRA